MKKSIFLGILLTLFLNPFSYSQDKPSCGTPPNSEEFWQTKQYVGNNNYLIGILKSNGINIPDDYFDKVDERGLYNGVELKPEDLRSVPGKNKSGGGVD